MLLSADEKQVARWVSELNYCNPFLPSRIDLERRILGPAFSDRDQVMRRRPGDDERRPNVGKLLDRVSALLERILQGLQEGTPLTDPDFELYEGLAVFHLYHRYCEDFDRSITTPRSKIDFYSLFSKDWNRYFQIVERKTSHDAAHLFAAFFQIRRAYFHIFNEIIGGSAPAVRLRAMVWQSIFTHDMRRYYRVLFERMGDMTTLVTGPSGSGKELVARAIGLSRYIRFETTTGSFAEDYVGSFLPLNLSAMSPSLIESELFGHEKGAFTGAMTRRIGWLERCPGTGTVFLDEIGELSESIQVKLLRVLEDRTFQRIGETETRTFRGKIVAATNRDLALEIEEGRFRADLYYRLCSDQIVTPGLAEQLSDSPGELRDLVLHLARREVGDMEGASLTDEVVEWIEGNLGDLYPWPGNVRELDQCVRNILIRGEYVPGRTPPTDPADRFLAAVRGGDLNAEEVLRGYCTLIYARTRNFEETGRRLGLDRRTVKARIDERMLAELATGSGKN